MTKGLCRLFEFVACLHGLTPPDGFDLQILRWAIDDMGAAAHLHNREELSWN